MQSSALCVLRLLEMCSLSTVVSYWRYAVSQLLSHQIRAVSQLVSLIRDVQSLNCHLSFL